MSHRNFTDIVNDIIHGDWGYTHPTQDEAEESLVDDPMKLAAFALIELLKRFNAVAEAVGEDKRQKFREREKLTIPEDAKAFPDKNVGDMLYLCEDLHYGASDLLILAKDENDLCLVVRTNNFDLDHPPQPFIADELVTSTLEEALVREANTDLNYHRAKVAYAESVLEAVKNGEDLTRFCNGFPEED